MVNVRKCAVVVCNEDKVKPVNASCKWVEDELPIEYQCTYLWRRDLKILPLGHTHSTCSKSNMGKGNAHARKMDTILTDSHLDTLIKSCTPMNVIAPKLEYAGEVWKGNAKFVKRLKTMHMIATKKF